TYNLVEDKFTYWDVFHQTAMEVIGNQVDLVGVPLEDLIALGVPNFGTCKDAYSYNNYYSAEKIMRDVPEFRPQISLKDAMIDILAAMDAAGRIDDSDHFTWEDRIIEAQRKVRQTKIN